VAPLVGKLAEGADFSQIPRDPELTPERVALNLTLVPNGAFELSLRAEPNPKGDGTLDVYYDLTSREPQLSHRIAALPSRVPPELAPVVNWMQSPISVSELVERAVTLLVANGRPAAQVREVSLELVRRAVIKGFARLEDRG